MPRQAKSKGGRPSSYKPEYAAQAAKLCVRGFTNPELAKFFGVSLATIDNWKASHAEFFDSLKTAKAPADDKVERCLYHRATGYSFQMEEIHIVQGKVVRVAVTKHVPPDTTAMIFWLKNRRKEQWRDSYAHTGPDGGAIQIEALETAMAKMNDKELAAFEKLIGPIAAAMRVTPGVAPGGRARKTPTEH